MPKHEESLWRTEDLADYLAISEREVQKLVDLIRIPHLKISQHLRFRKADIDRWLDSLKSPSLGQASSPASGPMLAHTESERRKSDPRKASPNERPTQCYQPPSTLPPRIEAAQMTAAPKSLRRFYTVREVTAITSLSRATLYRKMAKGSFPLPVQISENRVAWDKRVIDEWCEERLAKPSERAE
jgi:prophage regulatory protein